MMRDYLLSLALRRHYKLERLALALDQTAAMAACGSSPPYVQPNDHTGLVLQATDPYATRPLEFSDTEVCHAAR